LVFNISTASFTTGSVVVVITEVVVVIVVVIVVVVVSSHSYESHGHPVGQFPFIIHDKL